MESENCNEKCFICNLECNMAESWRHVLRDEFKKDYFVDLKLKLHKEKNVLPPPNTIFNFTNFFNLEDTKVVILGQDPYHGKDQANGLAFSVNKGIKLPPSLRNIFKEIISNSLDDFESVENYKNVKTDIRNASAMQEPSIQVCGDGDLSRWARQGVLLLNDCLTVAANKPNSHKKLGWNNFTNRIIELVDSKCQAVVFMLWGNFAQSKEKMINRNKHLILKSPHPSPFSCRKGFFGCKHFAIANDYLIKNGKKQINWI